MGAFGSPLNKKQLRYSGIISIDSRIGVSLRFVGKGFDLTGYLEDSYISVLERVSQCPECFAQNALPEACSNLVGVQTLVVTESSTWRKLNERKLYYNSSLL